MRGRPAAQRKLLSASPPKSHTNSAEDPNNENESSIYGIIVMMLVNVPYRFGHRKAIHVSV
jgi:hypothetical protein